MSNQNPDPNPKFGTTNRNALYFPPGEFRRAAMFVDDKIPTITFRDDYLELRTESRLAKIPYTTNSEPNDATKKAKFALSDFGSLYDLAVLLPDDLSEADDFDSSIRANRLLDFGSTAVILAKEKVSSKNIFDVGIYFNENGDPIFFIDHSYIENCGLELKLIELKEE